MPADSLQIQDRGNDRMEESRDEQGRFRPGHSGNPVGRLRGSRNRATMIAEAMLEAEAPALIRMVLNLALDGHPTALKLCMDRLVAPCRERPAPLDLPPLDSAADLAKVMGAITAAAGSGQITPAEAQRLAQMIATAMQAIENSDFERRLCKIEGRGGGE
jgi:hypothetical protein